MGRADFGSDWTGAELKARRFASTTPEPNIMFLPDEAGIRRVPESRPDRWQVQTADGPRVVFHSKQQARERWRDERSKLLENWEAEYAARERFDAVVGRIRDELYGGNLHAFAHRRRAGDLVNIPVHVWGRSDITAVFELGDSDWKWRHPNAIKFSAEIGNYGSHVSVEGPTLIIERELQALLAERPEHASEHEIEPGGSEEHTPPRVTPKNKQEFGEGNKAVATPRGTPRLAGQSSQKRRRGGAKPGPYYSKLKKFMEFLHEKSLEKFDDGTPAELRSLVELRFRNDGVLRYPKRSGLDRAIANAKREVIDSADRI